MLIIRSYFEPLNSRFAQREVKMKGLKASILDLLLAHKTSQNHHVTSSVSMLEPSFMLYTSESLSLVQFF